MVKNNGLSVLTIVASHHPAPESTEEHFEQCYYDLLNFALNGPEGPLSSLSHADPGILSTLQLLDFADSTEEASEQVVLDAVNHVAALIGKHTYSTLEDFYSQNAEALRKPTLAALAQTQRMSIDSGQGASDATLSTLSSPESVPSPNGIASDEEESTMKIEEYDGDRPLNNAEEATPQITDLLAKQTPKFLDRLVRVILVPSLKLYGMDTQKLIGSRASGAASVWSKAKALLADNGFANCSKTGTRLIKLTLLEVLRAAEMAQNKKLKTETVEDLKKNYG